MDSRVPLYIDGMFGLGDNLYQRAVLRELVKTRLVYLSTPWNQLYSDLPVRCVKAKTTLRTQSRNLARPAIWHTPPPLIEHRRWHYSTRLGTTMLQALCDDIGVSAEKIDFSGPPVPNFGREPYIVVRPATVRTEWSAASRNPRPEYIARAVDALRSRYRVVSVADLQPPYEVAVEPLPYADERYHRGELPVEHLLALVAGAAAVVAGVGWAVPAAVAYHRPLFLIYGGCLAHNGPKRIFDRRMCIDRVYQVMPDKPCMCTRSDHNCAKTISSLDIQIEKFAAKLTEERNVDCRQSA